MDLEKMKGKEFTFGVNGMDELEGKITPSKYGEEFVHFKGSENTDSWDDEYELRISAIVYFYEIETEEDEEAEEESEEEEEQAEEEKPSKSKYSNRSVNDIPEKKKKGWFG